MPNTSAFAAQIKQAIVVGLASISLPAPQVMEVTEIENGTEIYFQYGGKSNLQAFLILVTLHQRGGILVSSNQRGSKSYSVQFATAPGCEGYFSRKGMTSVLALCPDDITVQYGLVEFVTGVIRTMLHRITPEDVVIFTALAKASIVKVKGE